MKKIYSTIFSILFAASAMAQGWPANYDGVMLQGFFWDSFSDSKWKNIERQADELSQYFSLIWVPQSGKAQNSTSMGYDPLYYYNQSSSFGTEAELKSMISTLKSKGVGVIADVVVNHRGNVSNWVDFPKEVNPYDNKTYQMVSTDICADDDGGATKKWATENGYSLSSNNDTGESWGGMRDLDHKSANVQENVKAYLKYLINYLGYTGFRYDMVKGFGAQYLGQYNTDANPKFSVGEYWDGNANTVKNWIDGTGKKSAAFDFAFRYSVRDAIRGYRDGGSSTSPNWALLNSNTGVNIDNGNYKQYAVTFIENHDTQYRSATEQQDPIRKDTLAANAYLLAMPGTPCVFLPHWKAYKQEIKAMIDARKAAGITNTSSYASPTALNIYYANAVTGTKGTLLFVVGTNTDRYNVDKNNYVPVLSGYHYRYYLSKNTETAWADKASGEYEEAFDVTLTAVSSNAGAKLVYTLDGSEPKATSNPVASGTKINVKDDCTLKVGLLVNGVVKSIVTRKYTFNKFEKYGITVYVNTDKVNWSSVNFWTWGGDGSHTPTNGTWPGDRITATKTIDGKKWFYKNYTINNSQDFVNFVFSTNTGNPQTVDIENITQDTYFEISTEQDNSKYKVNDVTAQHTTGISSIITDKAAGSNTVNVYTIDGRLLRTFPAGTATEQATEGLQKGIYILNGRKIVVR